MVEIIPKEEPKLSRRVDVLFYFSLILMIAVAASFFILDLFQKKSLNTLQGLEDSLAKEETQERKALESRVLKYKEKIEDFSILLGSHQNIGNFFELLEKASHPKVWFSEILLEPQKFQMRISGETENFQTLGQQLFILEQNPSIKNVNLSTISLGKEGKVQFSLDFSLDPKIFK